MSSPQPTPPPQVPPPQRPVYRPRSLAGPVVLILVGVLCLMANMGMITWQRFGFWFAQYWPVLIILWGAIKLLEYYQAQRAGYRPRGIGAGGIVFLIFLIMFGISATRASRVNWGQVGADMDMDNGLFSWFGTTYTYNDEIEQPFTAGTSIRVTSDHGDVNVNTWDEPKLKIVVHKRVVTDGEDNAKKINEATKPQVTTANGVVTIDANTSGSGQNRVASDLDIYVPRAGAADIALRHGDAQVRGREGVVKASSLHGDVTVEDVKGDTSITVRHGSIRAEKVTGDLLVEGRVSDATISEVSGNVRLSGDVFGSMKIGKVGQSVQFVSSRTDMRFGRLDGELTLDSGDLRANQLAGPFSIVTRSKDIHLDDISGDIKIENTNGEVEIHATKLPLGNITVENRKGEIQLTVPAKSAFRFDAKTRRGDIESEFSELKVDSQHGESTATGSIGNGASHVQLNNQYGGITVRKST